MQNTSFKSFILPKRKYFDEKVIPELYNEAKVKVTDSLKYA